jgi:NTP pyrophosphatase (non-canonical NTP hydrolase)
MLAVLDEVGAERNRQEKLWGPQNHPASYYYLILAEEVGEVAKAILENKSSVAHTRSELVQVAAVAVAMVESLDRNGE